MFNNGTCGGGYSLADIAAATNNNGGFGGDGNGAWWLIVLFLFCFAGGWGNGNGVFGGGGSTGSGITDGYILTSDFANIERKIDGVNNGLCDGFYAMNTGMLNGFAGVNNQITQATIADMQNTNAITGQITGLNNALQSCCCENRYDMASKFADLNYNMATQSCQTRQAIADSTKSILDFLTQDKLATLTAENASLKAAANNAAQTWEIVNQLKPCPVPAYVVANPYCNCGSCGNVYA